MQFKIVFVLLIIATLSQAVRIKLHDDNYVPKRPLIPRTRVVPAAERNPGGIGPDDFFSFIPTYVGSVLPGKPLTWTGHCFQQNKAELTIDGNSSAILTMTLSEKKSLLCDDGYIIAYFSSFDLVYYELARTSEITWKGPWAPEELYDLTNLGLRIFLFPDGVTLTGEELFETVMMFFGALIGAHVPEWTASDNLQFLKDHMNVEMPVRNITRVNLDKKQIQSGDFLGIIRLDGLDPMLAWAMGSHTGHTAITMWINNELYVCESTTNSAYWPTNGIQATPWDTWMNQAEAADYNVLHLPLDPWHAKKFDVKKALELFNNVKGLPYGFHNLFTGWVDTPEDNYPPPLSSQLVQLLAPFAEWMLQKEMKLDETFDFLTQGLNFRLNTKGLNLGQAYMISRQRGIPFTQLVTIPEQDSWIFTNGNGTKGPSMVCDTFVMAMWKAGGLFEGLTDEIQAAEFTNWDAYTLKIFDGKYKRPAECVAADPTSQFCQILGKYRMDLPGYNTVTPFAHMRERCPSLPPLYIKPANC